MRFAVLLSGAGGFVLVMAVGLHADRDFSPVLRDAALACLGCAWVGRWFWRGLEKSFAQTLAARRAAAEAAEAEAPKPAPAAPVAARPAPSSSPAKPAPAPAVGAAR